MKTPTPFLILTLMSSMAATVPINVLASVQQSDLTTLSESSHLSSKPTSPQFLALKALSDTDYRWIGEKIYLNECAGLPKYLTHWGKGEAFPSFGIGHFIWHPKQKSTAPSHFIETFPAMLDFVSQRVSAPEWLIARQKQAAISGKLSAPWTSKSEFDQAWSNTEMAELRTWLLVTQSEQARFIVKSFIARWTAELSALSLERQKALNHRLNKLMQTKKGSFAVIDYFNFKGIGLNSKEQYQGESWGLASVLLAMPNLSDATESERLTHFIDSAKARLSLRTQLAPESRNEQ
ncbi:MAG: hypothetical protein GXO35_04450, partial [Gammaproteobacteria bacterium]|nr:hypothetical protein [Gammaproteobacteria bacterium]